MRLKVATLLIGLSLLVAPRALAQGLPSFDLERLQLDPTAAGSLVVGDGETGLQGSWRVSLAVNEYELSQSAEALAGVRWTHGPVELFALGGPGFRGAPGTPAWRGLIGIALVPGAVPGVATPAK